MEVNLYGKRGKTKQVWLCATTPDSLFAPNTRLLTYNVPRYTIIGMIASFKCKETEKIFNRTFSKKFSPSIQLITFRKLRMLHRAYDLNDLRVPPGNRLERLGGDRADQYSIRINAQYRICFEWHDKDCHNVEIVDYH